MVSKPLPAVQFQVSYNRHHKILLYSCRHACNHFIALVQNLRQVMSRPSAEVFTPTHHQPDNSNENTTEVHVPKVRLMENQVRERQYSCYLFKYMCNV